MRREKREDRNCMQAAIRLKRKLVRKAKPLQVTRAAPELAFFSVFVFIICCLSALLHLSNYTAVAPFHSLDLDCTLQYSAVQRTVSRREPLSLSLIQFRLVLFLFASSSITQLTRPTAECTVVQFSSQG